VFIGVIKLEVFLPLTNSLKAKRRVISSFMNRLRNIYNVSVREIDFFDLWQRSLIAIVFVSISNRELDILCEKIENFIYDFGEFEVVNIERERL
jgi:uncharacterized protein YlxP (DUF503 family)